MKDSPLVNKSISLSLLVISYVSELKKSHLYSISDQLLKSATSVGANIHEAQFAESKADFIHKLKVSEKEVNETIYWLTLCQRHDTIVSPSSEIQDLTMALKRMLRSSITTLKNKQ
jgi:four helix bundle protein